MADSGLNPAQFAALHNVTVFAKVGDSDLSSLGAILDSVGEIEIESGRPRPWTQAITSRFWATAVRSRARVLSKVDADIAQAVQVSDDDVERLPSPLSDEDLAGLSVVEAIAYVGAINYVAPQSGGSSFQVVDDAATLHEAEVNGDPPVWRYSTRPV